MTSTRYSLSLAIALLLVIMLIGLGIQKEAYRAVAPPIYDPVEYMQKGKAVWSLVAQGDFARVLNAPPTLRPPGCVPFCYPFGYQADFRSFLFWSTLSPIILWALAVLLALGKCIKAPGESILPFAWSLGLISLPMFYHFELSGVNEAPFVGHWGIQDCLLASIAALATSMTAIGARKRLFFLTILGWSSAAYCLFIKPAGLLVMFAVAGIWLIEITISTLQSGLRSVNVWWLAARRYVLMTLFAGGTVFGFAILSALSSEYLSKNNIHDAIVAQGILVSLVPPTAVIPTAISYVRPVLGWWWFLIFGISYVAALAAGIWSLARKRFLPTLLRPWGALMIILASGYWLCFMAGFQARYYFPFILIVIIWLLPDLVRYSRTFSRGWRIFLATPPLLTTFILVGLLWSGSPEPRLERWLGFNLASGAFAEEVELGRQLIEEARTAKRSLQIYSMPSIRAGVVFSVDYLDSISSGQPPHLSFTFELGWARAPGVRLEEILHSDYLFVEEDHRATFPVKIETFDQESSAYHAWLRSLGEQQGVSWVKRGPLSVLGVRNVQQLRDAFRQFVAQHEWREVFIQNNAELFPTSGSKAVSGAQVTHAGSEIRTYLQASEPPSTIVHAAADQRSAYNIDTVNGLPPGTDGTAISARSALKLWGWCLVSPKDGIAPDEVWIALTASDGKRRFYRATQEPRPAVNAYFGHPNMKASGFVANIDLLGLSGEQKLDLYEISDGVAIDCSLHYTVNVGATNSPLLQASEPPSAIVHAAANPRAAYNIDTVNDLPAGKDGTAISVQSALKLRGWCLVSPKDGIAPDEVWILLTASDGKRRFYRATQESRPDVDAYFGHPNMKESGFVANIDLLGLSGEQKLDLYEISDSVAVDCSLHRTVNVGLTH